MPDHESDTILMERFVRLHEEDAFVALVRRHGPAVLKVCRRFLRNEHDVEDVFQATFLVLAQKASRVAWTGSIDAWLRNVARRLALHLRTRLMQRHARETGGMAIVDDGWKSPASDLFADRTPASNPSREVEQRDLRRAIDEALKQLPEKYRAPVVLCYLEGKTNEEAARQLGWPTGSMSRRLERGRDLLRRSLSRYGVALAVGLIGLTAVMIRGEWPASRFVSMPPGRFPSVRHAMAPLAAQDQGGHDFEEFVSRLADDRTQSLDRERLRLFAVRAAKAAERVEAFDPGRDREIWRASAAEMKRSANALAEASRSDDRTEMISSARRLDATCVRCHGRFRRVSLSETRDERLGVWPSGRRSDKIH